MSELVPIPPPEHGCTTGRLCPECKKRIRRLSKLIDDFRGKR